MQEVPETHQQGTISLENMPTDLKDKNWMRGDLGIQVAEDGRIWLCVNGISFIRFSPHPNGKMSK